MLSTRRVDDIFGRDYRSGALLDGEDLVVDVEEVVVDGADHDPGRPGLPLRQLHGRLAVVRGPLREDGRPALAVVGREPDLDVLGQLPRAVDLPGDVDLLAALDRRALLAERRDQERPGVRVDLDGHLVPADTAALRHPVTRG